MAIVIAAGVGWIYRCRKQLTIADFAGIEDIIVASICFFVIRAMLGFDAAGGCTFNRSITEKCAVLAT